MWNWNMWYFTCVFGTCDVSHVKFHMLTHVQLCVSHVKFHMWIWNMWIWNMWFGTCEKNTCEIMCFTCEIAHVNLIGTCEFGTCDFSHVNTYEIMCLTCETSHVKFHMWIWNMWNIISHVKFHTCEIMWNFCKGLQKIALWLQKIVL
jgi:hypothetical protein